MCFWCLGELNAQMGDPCFIRLGINEGLPSSKIYCLHQDRKGYLWMGSDRGLCRYNGKTFELFGEEKGLEDPIVLDIQEDNQGLIWLRTFQQHLYYLPESADTILPHPLQAVLGEMNAPNTILTSFYVQKDSTWLGLLYAGISKATPQGIREENEQVVKTPYYGYRRFDNNQFVWVVYHGNYSFSQPTLLSDGTVIAISSTNPKQLLIWQPNAETPITKEFPAGLHRIYQDKNNDIWITTMKGIYQYPQGNLEQTPLHWFKELSIVEILQIEEGGYWLICADTDLIFVPSFQNVLIEKWNVISTTNDDNTLIINTFDGIFEVKKENSNRLHRQLVSIPPRIASAMLLHPTPDYYLWYGSEMALDAQKRSTNVPLKNATSLKTYARTPQGDIWSGSVNGIDYYGKNQTAIDRQLEQLKFLKRVTALCYNPDKNGLWVGTPQGLWYYDITSNQIKKFADMPALDKAFIKFIQRDSKGDLWIGTQGKGLFFITANHSFKQEQVSADFINCIYLQGDTGVWIGSNKGLFYRSKPLARWLHITPKEGLPHNEVNSIAFFQQQLWIGTSGGVVLMQKVPSPSQFAPPVHLRAVQIADKWYSYPKAFKDTLCLEHYQNQLSLHFDAPCYMYRPDYQYKLEGLDTGWHRTSNTEINYFNLTPGDYTFWLSTQSQSGTPNPKPVRLFIRIKPHFTQTAWFWSLFALAITSVLAGFVYWRVKALVHKKNIERRMMELEYNALKSQMNPHFTFNALQSILALVKMDKKADAQKYLQQFSHLLRKLLENASLKLITLQQELDILQTYVSLELMRWGHKVQVEWVIPQPTPVFLLPPMLLQPIIENAFVHAFKTIKANGLLHIEIACHRHHWCFIVTDNGIGRQTAQTLTNVSHQATALANIQERILKIKETYNLNISLKINDLHKNDAAAGTQVIVSIDNCF